MPIDKVRPLKIENSATGGTEDNLFPHEADPTEDYTSVKGVALEDSDDHRIEKVGNEVALVDPVSGTKKSSDLLDAEQENFDPLTSGLVSTKTGPAIRELKDLVDTALSETIYPVDFAYNGNANIGRYLEAFSGMSSDEFPEILPRDGEIDFLYLYTNNDSGDCDIGIFETGDLVTPIYEFTILDGDDTKVIDDIGVAVSKFDKLAVRVTSGSRNKPRMRIWINTGT